MFNIVKRKKSKKGFFGWFFKRHDPMQYILNVIAIIVIIYGAWFNELSWILLGFVPILVGYWWEYVNRK